MHRRYFAGGDGTRRARHDAGWLRKSWLMWLAAIGCILVVVQFRTFAFPARQAAAGPQLSALHLQGLAGGAGTVRLRDLEGRVAVLHLWSPNVAPCRTQLSYIAELQQKFRSHSAVMILPVCYGKVANEDIAVLDYETRLFLQQANINMPCYFDPQQVTRKAALFAAGAEELPLTLVIDRRGIVRRSFGQLTSEDAVALRQLILELVAQ